MEYANFSEWLAKIYMCESHVGRDERLNPQERRASDNRVGRVLYALTSGTMPGKWTLIDVEWTFSNATQVLGPGKPAYLALPGRPAFAIDRTMTEALNSVDAVPDRVPGKVDLSACRDIRTMILVVDSEGAEPLIRDTIALFKQKSAEMKWLIFVFTGEIDVPEWMLAEEHELASKGVHWFKCRGREAEGDVEFA